jgi:hypothetical protein
MSIAALIGVPVFLCLYYLLVLWKIGPEPKLSTVVARYEPPAGLSPAAARYVWRSCVDGRTVAAIFAQLASRGWISINWNGGSCDIKRLFEKGKPLPEIAPEENAVLDLLFAGFFDKTAFDPAKDTFGFVSMIRGSLDRNLRNRYCERHIGYLVLGVLGSALAASIMASVMTVKDEAVLFELIAFCVLGVPFFGYFVAANAVSSLRAAAQGTGSPGRTVLSAALALVAAAGFYLIARTLAMMTSLGYVASLLSTAAINIAFVPALKRTTPTGKALKEEIAGFREFLVTVEQDAMDRLNVPKQNLTAQPHIAYAIALEVKEAWGDHLSNCLSW